MYGLLWITLLLRQIVLLFCMLLVYDLQWCGCCLFCFYLVDVFALLFVGDCFLLGSLLRCF